MGSIKMVDLAGQYLRSKQEIDEAIQRVLLSSDFIQGREVKEFEYALSHYLDEVHVVSCANGTDALQISMMALDFKPGDEVILPSFTYVATAEVIALLGLVPVFADVNRETFNLDAGHVGSLLSKRTVAIVPVHLFGQCADLEPILSLAKEASVHVIEDAAQALGSTYIFKEGRREKAGTIGRIGTTSFFPAKNLGAYGDGGAMLTRDKMLAEKLRMIANHGQQKKYHHELVGVNSRLDTLQAAILCVKLKYLDSYAEKRQKVAAFYDTQLHSLDWLNLPARSGSSTHVFHQYTIRVQSGKRDALRAYLQAKSIPSMIYYPLPIHFQNAYRREGLKFPVSESLCSEVLSLPIHTEMDENQLSYICDVIKTFR